ncbi:MAG: FHA domain-containing protein, partial [Planctomycetota bacterium]|nr:FHA domain-containing protein [Planctomycetota bacterium]
MPRLVKNDGESVILTGRKVRIGRSSQNDINVKLDGISRMHCELRSVDGGYIIVDLGSSNGTWVNKKKITRHELQDGDRIQIGRLKMKYYEEEGDEDADVASTGRSVSFGGGKSDVRVAHTSKVEAAQEEEEDEEEEESEAKRKKREFLE